MGTRRERKKKKGHVTVGATRQKAQERILDTQAGGVRHDEPVYLSVCNVTMAIRRWRSSCSDESISTVCQFLAAEAEILWTTAIGRQGPAGGYRSDTSRHTIITRPRPTALKISKTGHEARLSKRGRPSDIELEMIYKSSSSVEMTGAIYLSCWPIILDTRRVFSRLMGTAARAGYGSLVRSGSKRFGPFVPHHHIGRPLCRHSETAAGAYQQPRTHL